MKPEPEFLLALNIVFNRATNDFGSTSIPEKVIRERIALDAEKRAATIPDKIILQYYSFYKGKECSPHSIPADTFARPKPPFQSQVTLHSALASFRYKLR